LASNDGYPQTFDYSGHFAANEDGFVWSRDISKARFVTGIETAPIKYDHRGLPGGKCDTDTHEVLLAAAAREVFEETSLSIEYDRFSLIPYSTTKLHKGKIHKMFWAGCIVSPDEVKRLERWSDITSPVVGYYPLIDLSMMSIAEIKASDEPKVYILRSMEDAVSVWFDTLDGTSNGAPGLYATSFNNRVEAWRLQ
jgi:8-oxo-dGTP pyrophosphatase MutT (NUDIX family)